MSDLDDQPLVRVTLLLADAAQVADRKLFVMGGGINLIGPRPQPVALAVLVEVPWDRANIKHQWQLELVDADGMPVMANDRPVLVGGEFEAGRPPGIEAGTPLPVPMAINFSGLPVEPGTSYQLRFAVDGTTEPEWMARFSVRPNPAQPA